MPDPLEFPRMLRAVVPLVRSRDPFVLEGIADLLPRLPTIVGALDLLPEPTARLRGVNSIGRHGRALEVIHLPAGKERAGNLPLVAPPIGGQNECPFAGASEDADAAHDLNGWRM